MNVEREVSAGQERDHQVAALCWRRDPRLEVLLITTLRTGRWILPKGWPVAGLTLAQSAAQEALEEAGVVGDVAAEPFASYSYLKEKKTGAMSLTVDIFPLKVTGQRPDWAEKGARELAWLPVEQAAKRVKEIALRQIIREFRKRLAA
jgi:8-oxo-dGTP pyrophosphatase MutT (NUDIX family)